MGNLAFQLASAFVLAAFQAAAADPGQTSPTPSRPPVRSTPDLARACTPTVVTVVTKNAVGSGVIVDERGVVATNLHVLQGAEHASIRLANGDTYDDVSVVDVDSRKDLALGYPPC